MALRKKNDKSTRDPHRVPVHGIYPDYATGKIPGRRGHFNHLHIYKLGSRRSRYLADREHRGVRYIGATPSFRIRGERRSRLVKVW